MNVAVFQADGSKAAPGEVGELVCRTPWPAMTRGLRGDPERYLDTYWRRFPGVWTHGDWATVDEDGFWFLHGRSDGDERRREAPPGRRRSKASLTLHPSVVEVRGDPGVPDDVKGEAIWCFVVAGTDAPPDLAHELGALVADHLGEAFRPSRVVVVPELPRTRSKILRRAIRAASSPARAGRSRPREPRCAGGDPRRALMDHRSAAAAPPPDRWP